MKWLLYLTLIFAILISCKDDEKKDEKVVVANLDDQVITSVLVDKANNKWVGTESGLYKSVDGGYTLEDVSFAGKIISLGYDSTSNTLWVGTVGGLSKLSIAGTDVSATAIPSSDLSNNIVNTTFTDSSSRIWFGTDTGISLNKSGKYKKADFMSNILGDMFPLEFEDTKVNSIACWDGDYYFATSGMGIYRAFGYDASMDAFTGATQLAAPYNGQAASDSMFVVFTDSKGRQWMGGNNGLQSHTGHDTKAQESFMFFIDILPSLSVHALAESKDGKIWVGTEKGLAIYDNTSWKFQTDNLPNVYITSIAFDKDGSAWVGTKKGLVNIK
jgi:ligand-binding sensor domain-containing protein